MSASGTGESAAAARLSKGRRQVDRNRSTGRRYDAETVVTRLEEAGRTLLSLPPGGHSTGLRTNTATLVRRMIEAGEASATPGRLQPAVPPADGITRMDEALGWIPLIPNDRTVLRRIVGARALVNPMTDRHLYPWRRLGSLLGADHKAVQRWHAQGVELIVRALNDAG